MTDLQSRFYEEKAKHPLHSTFINYQNALKGMKITRRGILAGFLIHVDKKDYDDADTERLIDYLSQKV